MALRDINLVPDDFLFRQNLSRHLSLWAIFFILSMTSVFGFHIYQKTTTNSKKLPIDPMMDATEQLGLKIDEIKRLQDELVRLDQQKSGLENISRNPVYSRVLLKLAEIMSNHTWVTQLTIEKDEETKTESLMSLRGYAKNSADLGDLIKNLNENSLFYDVFLRHAQEAMLTEYRPQMNEPSSLIEFQLECRVRG